jgi:hypothetical protein
MVTALGVDVDTSGNGVDPLTHRNIIKAHWVNTGVVEGLVVSGRGDLRYAVSAGVGVCSMGDADGYVEAYWPGGVTENAVSAGDGTYARIDTVYLLANTGTPDNVVHCRVVQGTPSASPVAPVLPAGALALMSMLMPAGGSSTGASSRRAGVGYAVPYGVSLGLMAQSRNTGNDAFSPSVIGTPRHAVDFTLSTDRLVEIRFQCRVTGGSGSSSMYFSVNDNGDVLDPGTGQLEFATAGVAELKSYSNMFSMAAGDHHVVLSVRANASGFRFYGFGSRMFVIDQGVAR